MFRLGGMPRLKRAHFILHGAHLRTERAPPSMKTHPMPNMAHSKPEGPIPYLRGTTACLRGPFSGLRGPNSDLIKADLGPGGHSRPERHHFMLVGAHIRPGMAQFEHQEPSCA